MQLVVQAGSQCGQVYKIDKDALTIGRGSSNDITFVDPAMSRVHCEIRREGDDYVVEDRHSANGTFVNDEQIELPFILRPGDTVRMGQTVLLFQQEDSGQVAEDNAAAAGVQGAPSAGGESEPAPRPWLLIAGAVGVLVLILSIAFALSNRAPVTNVAVAPSPTVRAVVKASPTLIPTNAPTEVVPSPIPTVAATATLPATLVPPATQPAPTATASATETPTAVLSTLETATAAATQVGAPSPVMTAQTKTYPVPVLSLVLPAPQSRYGANAPIPFSWIAVDVLDPNEQYRVQVAANDQFSPTACEIKTRETHASIPGEGVTCNSQWQFGQHYYWRVHIIPRDSFFVDPVASADTAPVNEFTWGP